MCGICGFVKKDFSLAQRSDVESMTKLLSHRGPDYQSAFVDRYLALGHARLSIIDLTESANQPMTDLDSGLTIVFNGEIYNYKTLREELINLNIRFNTHSDTEVLLKGYQVWGVSMFQKLNGIFAFSIWNAITEELILVRDRFGVKPLYLFNKYNYFAFASEIKSILNVVSVCNKINQASLHEFMYYGNALGDKTMFQDISKVNPGKFIIFNKGKITEEYYWRPEDLKINNNISFTEAVLELRNRLESSISSQLVSDVPVGIFLSGGIDSSTIAAFASKHYTNKIDTYSIAFDYEEGKNELEKASIVAKLFETNHHEFQVKIESLQDVIEKLVYHHDEPFSDAANIPLYLLSKEVQGKNKVILQGDGGDEIFAGYRRYIILNNISYWKTLAGIANIGNALLPFRMEKRKSRFIQAVLEKDDAMRMALFLTIESKSDTPLNVLHPTLRMNLNRYDPFIVYKGMNSRFENLDLVQRMLWTDTQIILPNTFLEKVDKSTMANGIEVRVPLLDNHITEFVMPLPSQFKVYKAQKKYLLRQAMRGILPASILDAPKTGFGVPYENWLRIVLKDYLKNVLWDPYLVKLNIFDYNYLNLIIEEHQLRKNDHGFLLWKCMNLAIWMKRYKIEIGV